MEIKEIVNRLNDIHKEANEYDNAVCYVTSDDNEVIEAAIKKLEQFDCLYKVGLLKDCESCKAESTISSVRDDIPLQKNVPPMPRKIVANRVDTIKGQGIGYWINTGRLYMDDYGHFSYEELCSSCKGLAQFRRSNGALVGANFCPNCGRRMLER